ncbi:MAG: glycoside hydrolase family 25 protein [Actinomycetota bacterium]|nr:glycoside hydrolase family 25 protein [Actinomycetota bacterium]
MNPLNLPDVSEFQPNVDWKAVAAHNGGAAIIRALYGTSHVDKAWYGGARRKEAHQDGIKVLGIYQYLVAGQDAVAQANAFVQLVGHLAPGEFAVLDLEEGSGSQLARAEAWLQHVDAHLTYPGYKGAWLYSGASFFQSAGLMPIANSKRHTWVAAYGQSHPPSVPHTLWQNSSGVQWPGIGKCDNSIYMGDLHGLRAAIGG